MVVLSIRNESTGRQWRVWPDPEPIPVGAVRETGSYLFELRNADEAASADLLIDDTPLEALRVTDSEASRWRWLPGFHAGTIEVELRIPSSGTKRFEVVTDPDLRKLTRGDFDGMVREILEDTFALFALSGFRKSVAHGTGGRPPAIARLEFLRSRIDELEEVAHAIARSPRHKLAAEETTLPYHHHRAVRATGPEILRSFRSGRILRESGRAPCLPNALDGFLPERIRLRRRRSSLDLPEHRQMAACLKAWSGWLRASGELLDRASSTTSGDAETRKAGGAWAARCRRMAKRLSQIGELAPFAEASEGEPRLMLSSIFRVDPAYRRFYRLWQDMNLGIASVFGDFLGMPLARTFELYELWCFLRLVRTAAEEFGGKDLSVEDLFLSDASGGVTVAAGAVTVPVGSGWKLCFQKQYREFWLDPNQRGSFSRVMKPDVALGQGSKEGTMRLIILDAKYRIEDGLNEALNSIHTYRDALVRQAETGDVEGIVTAAYLLTPHLPQLDGVAGYRDMAMPGRLFHPEYRQNFQFGAVTLRPGMSRSELREVLRIVIRDATL